MHLPFLPRDIFSFKVCHWLLGLLFISLVFESVAQINNPVTSNTVLIPPHSLNVEDLIRPENNAIQVTLILNELNRFGYQGRLELIIEGSNGVTLRTLPNINPVPVTLDGGIPSILFGADLAPLFDGQNLSFQGISRAQYERTHQLPEGFYSFRIEVFDAIRADVRVSRNEIAAQAFFIRNEPPILNFPVNGNKLRASSPQNIVFSWTPRHTASPNAATNVEYTFTLVQIIPENRDPNDALNVTSTPIFQTFTNSTTIVYGPAEPQLDPGAHYAWRVQATDVGGLDLFTNQGISEAYRFQFGDACQPPTELEARGTAPARIDVSWTPQFNHTEFEIRYRRAGSNNEWVSQSTILPEYTITNLNPDTRYEVQVMADCGVGILSDPTNIITAKTQVPFENEANCGVQPAALNITDQDAAELYEGSTFF